MRKSGILPAPGSTLLALGAMLFALSFPVEAQQAANMPRIGWLLEGSAPSGSAENLQAFRQGLRELGYVEGKNIALDYRAAEGKEDRLSELAAELLQLKADVIIADGASAIRTAKKTIKTAAVIFVTSADPVATGIVASLARPGGNVTGLITLSPELLGKRLELLKEAFPKVSRVAVLTGNAGPGTKALLEEMRVTARSLGLRLQFLEIQGPNDFETAFRAATRERAGALIEMPTPIFHENEKRIVDFAISRRLPAVFHTKDFVDAGGLMSYGTHYPDLYRRLAAYVDKILKGRKPSDLPVEQPTKFEFIINLKAAKQIGLTIPPNVLARADKVIK